jgi:hypothetical protein
MPKQRKWVILRSFEWMPNPSIIMVFKAGEVHAGLTRACREKAGDRIKEIRD